MISPVFHQYGPRLEAARVVQVSHHRTFTADLSKYTGDEKVLPKIHTVTMYFKEKNYFALECEFNNHELTHTLRGFKSIHLFPRTTKDVVIVYKSHREGFHIVFHRIGNHDWVYNPNYEKMDKRRRMKKRGIQREIASVDLS